MPWATKRFGSWDSYTGPVRQVPLPGKETEAECRETAASGHVWLQSPFFQLYPVSSPAAASAPVPS